MEFNTNTGDFFMSDKMLAENFGVSEKTISRTMTSLETKGFIKRETRNTKGGRTRHIKVCLDKINKVIATDKMTVDSSNQQTNCPLATDKMTVGNGQNDFIKDNLIDNEKDNIGVDRVLLAPLANTLSTLEPTRANRELTKAEMVAKFKKEMGF